MAVYTEVSDVDLTAFASEYDIGEVLACKGIAEGIENSNFQLTTSTGNYILTLYEKRVNPDDLPFFIGLMKHLAAKGIPCPTPVKGNDGEALRSLSGRPACIVTFLAGMWPRRIDADQCAQLGEGLALLHTAAADFPLTRANALDAHGWRPMLEQCQGRADEIAPGLTEELITELDFLEANWPTDLPTGVIHADLFPDNVFFRDGRLSGFIDFYFACNDTLMYDLGICLNAWCFEPDGSFNVTKARRMVKGYLSGREVSDAELQALPLLARGAAMRFLTTRVYDWLNTPEDAFVTPKNPQEYIKKLRFHRSVKGLGDYGLGN